MICFSGNRRELDDYTGIENCSMGLIPLLDMAREKNVNLVMELLNKKSRNNILGICKSFVDSNFFLY